MLLQRGNRIAPRCHRWHPAVGGIHDARPSLPPPRVPAHRRGHRGQRAGRSDRQTGHRGRVARPARCPARPGGTPGGRLRPVRRPAAARSLRRQPEPHPQLPVLCGRRPAAAHLPAQRGPALHRHPVRWLGSPRRRAARTLDRAPAHRARPGVRQHRRQRVPGQGEPDRQRAGRLPGRRPGRRVRPGLPVGVPGELHRPGGERAAGVGALLHPAQDHGRAARPVPAGRQPAGAGRAGGQGRLGQGPHRPAQHRAAAGHAAHRVRRHERGAGQPVPGHRRPEPPDHRDPVRPRRDLRPAGQPARPAGRLPRQHADPQDHRRHPGVPGHRAGALPRHRHVLLGHRGRPPHLRQRRQQ